MDEATDVRHIYFTIGSAKYDLVEVIDALNAYHSWLSEKDDSVRPTICIDGVLRDGEVCVCVETGRNDDEIDSGIIDCTEVGFHINSNCDIPVHDAGDERELCFNSGDTFVQLINRYSYTTLTKV